MFHNDETKKEIKKFSLKKINYHQKKYNRNIQKFDENEKAFEELHHTIKSDGINDDLVAAYHMIQESRYSYKSVILSERQIILSYKLIANAMIPNTTSFNDEEKKLLTDKAYMETIFQLIIKNLSKLRIFSRLPKDTKKFNQLLIWHQTILPYLRQEHSLDIPKAFEREALTENIRPVEFSYNAQYLVKNMPFPKAVLEFYFLQPKTDEYIDLTTLHPFKTEDITLYRLEYPDLFIKMDKRHHSVKISDIDSDYPQVKLQTRAKQIKMSLLTIDHKIDHTPIIERLEIPLKDKKGGIMVFPIDQLKLKKYDEIIFKDCQNDGLDFFKITPPQSAYTTVLKIDYADISSKSFLGTYMDRRPLNRNTKYAYRLDHNRSQNVDFSKPVAIITTVNSEYEMIKKTEIFATN